MEFMNLFGACGIIPNVVIWVRLDQNIASLKDVFANFFLSSQGFYTRLTHCQGMRKLT